MNYGKTVQAIGPACKRARQKKRKIPMKDMSDFFSGTFSCASFIVIMNVG